MVVTFRYILLTAARDRLVAGLIAALLAAALLGSFLGEATIMEGRAMALAYAGFATRLILQVGLILFVCFHVQRAYENREIDLMLSRPVSRPQFVLITWASFAGVAIFLTLAAVDVLPLAGWPARGALALWAASLILETLVVVAAALFFALTIRSAVGATMATFGFYLLARMAGFLLGVVGREWNDLTSTVLGKAAGYGVYVIGMVLPRLDLFGQTSWLVYGGGKHSDFAAVAGQAAIYVPLLLAASIFDFRRKRF